MSHPIPISFSYRKYGRLLTVDGRTCPRWTGVVEDGVDHVLDFHEVLLVGSGTVRVQGGAGAVNGAGRAVIITPPHARRRVFVEDPLHAHLVVASPVASLRLTGSWPTVDGPAVFPIDPPTLTHLRAIAQSIATELESIREDSSVLLESLWTQLLVLVARARGRGVSQRRPSLVERFERLLERRIGDLHDVAAYASALAVSPDHLSATVRAHYGISAKKLIDLHVVRAAGQLLMDADKTVDQISDQLGYSEPPHFARVFRRVAGVSPTAFRRRH